MDPKVAALLETYRLATSEYDKAVLEQQLWMTLPKEEQEERRRRVWVNRTTGAPRKPVEERWTLLGAGEPAEALWERVTREQMPLITACERLKEARGLVSDSDGKLSLKTAVAMRLQEYDTWPMWRTVDGQSYRRKRGGRTKTTSTKTPKTVSVEDAAETPDRQFWGFIREAVRKFSVSDLNKDIDPLIAEKLRQEFELDLRTLCSEHSAKFYRARVAGTKAQSARVSIKPAKLLSACSALSMDPPKHGKPVDLNRAKTQKKKLVRLYHPDIAGGNDGTRGMYEAVINAYETLSEYNQQLTETEPI